jgi:transposase InsO family protein
MPWQEHRTVDLREQFVLKASEPLRNMSELCGEFGISRKTGYLWLDRFETEGVAGLEDRSSRPRRITGTSAEVVVRISELRREHPYWGPKKIRALLKAEKHKAPSVKTITRIAGRLGLASLRPKRDRKPKLEREGKRLLATKSNEVWTFDFKGWWKTQDGKRFEPLTVRDAASRFILLCVHSRETFAAVKKHCERLFRRYGVPALIRADNGPPFAAIDAMGGLSRLSAWWTSLGIEVSFSRPATPSDNGGHERMHADIAAELQQHPAANTAAQQRLVDEWVRKFNYVRPHEALGQRTPASVYRRSKTRMKQLEPKYPADAVVTRVSAKGRIKLDGFQYFVGTNLMGMRIGIRRIDEKLFVLFFDKNLGALTSTPQRAR